MAKPKLVRLYDEGYRMALIVGESADGKRLKVIVPDSSGLDVRQHPADDEVNFTFYDEAASKKAVAQFIEMGKRFGITERAKRYLTG